MKKDVVAWVVIKTNLTVSGDGWINRQIITGVVPAIVGVFSSRGEAQSEAGRLSAKYTSMWGFIVTEPHFSYRKVTLSMDEDTFEDQSSRIMEMLSMFDECIESLPDEAAPN
jgi:hypothetical protein